MDDPLGLNTIGIFIGAPQGSIDHCAPCRVCIIGLFNVDAACQVCGFDVLVLKVQLSTKMFCSKVHFYKFDEAIFKQKFAKF